MKKAYIYTRGYYGRQIFRKIRKKYKILGFIDQKIYKKKIFNKKTFLPKNIKDYDFIFFSGFKKNEYLKLIKNNKFNLKKSIYINTSEVKINRNFLKIREKETLKILKKITKILNSKNFEYFMNFSSLLTLIRKDNFAYYSDVDISINRNDLNKLKKYLNKNSIFKYIKFKKKQIVIFSQFSDNFNFEPATVDLAAFSKGKISTLFPSKNGSLKIKNKYIFETKLINYKNLKLRVPHNQNEFLKTIYGKNFIKKPLNW